jgi:hypothetical protein
MDVDPDKLAPERPEDGDGDDNGGSEGSPAGRALAARLARLRDTAPPDPPPALEARLRSSLAARRPRRSWMPRTPWTRLAGVGAGLLAAAALALWLTQARERRRNGQPLAMAPGPAAPAPIAGSDRPAPSSPRPGRFRPLDFAHQPETIFTHTARVELGAETAAYFGWPVAADVPRARVQAEVLYGEDGVARGLRFLPASFRSLPLPQERGVNP